MAASSQTLCIGTRKGLFTASRSGTAGASARRIFRASR